MIKKLHPRSVGIYLLVWFLLALLFNDLPVLLAMMVIIGWLNFQVDSGRSLKKVFRFALPMVILILAVNTLLNQQGATLLWTSGHLPVMGPIKIFSEPLFFGLGMGVKLLVILGIFTVFNRLVPAERFIEIFGSNAGSAAMVTGITVRIVPELALKTQSIREVQAYRGINHQKGKLTTRIKNWGLLVGNLLRSALEGSIKTAEAMQARGYDSGKRTVYIQQPWSPLDTVVSGLAITSLTLVLGLINLGDKILIMPVWLGQVFILSGLLLPVAWKRGC